MRGRTTQTIRAVAAISLALCCGTSPAAPPFPGPPTLVLQAPPAAPVDSVTVSPDGSIVATGAGEGGVRLYDAGTGALLRAIGEAGDRSVAFAPDGRSLAAAGYHMDKLVGIYDGRTGRRLRTLAGHTEWETYATTFSPDGALLASAGADRQVLVWDLATGSIRHRLGDGNARVSTLAFSPDGKTLAGGGEDRTVRLWDTATGALRRSLSGHGDWVCAVAFAPDGKTLASASCAWASRGGGDWRRPASRDAEKSEWRLWDAASGKLRRTTIEPGRLLALAFAPDGKSLACAIEREARRYELAVEAPGRVVATHDSDVTSVAFSPDGRAIYSGSLDQTVRRVDAETGTVRWRAPGYFEQVNSVAVSPDGSILAAGSSDRRFALRLLKTTAPELGPGAVRLWDARRGRLLRRLGDPADQVMAVAIAPDGGRVAAGGARPDGAGLVRAWDAATGADVWSKADHAAEVLAVAFAPDGSAVASAGAEGIVTLRDAATGSATRRLEGHRGGATSLAYSADGALLVCGEGQGGVRVWDARTGRLLQTCRDASSRADSETRDRLITSVALRPDGSTFLACTASIGNTYGEPARLWDARTGRLVRAFDEPRIGGRPIAVSPDGSILAGGGKTVVLWDMKSGKPLRRLVGHFKKTQALAFSADGRRLYNGGSYGTVNAWDVATGRHLVTLFAFPEARGGTLADEWLALRPDGFYDGSPGIDRRLAWRVGDDLVTPATVATPLRRPEQVEDALGPAAPGRAGER